jgi:thiamine-phosphate pyrophosphorylase
MLTAKSSPQIYLISPPNFDLKDFSKKLENALKNQLVPIFQMRVKNYEPSEIRKISLELKKICHQNNCKFLLNDFHDIALEINADGVHLGADDANIFNVRNNSPKNFIIGSSCYDSKELALRSVEQGADYISFGAFFESKTKKSRGKPSMEILEWSAREVSLPVSVIGGIDSLNCAVFSEFKVDYLCVISSIWNHEKGESFAVKELYQAIKKPT